MSSDMSGMDMNGMDMSGMDMSGMDMSDMSMMSMMSMTFFSSTTTPLFSKKLTPTSTGAYAGLCIFLVILAVVTRCLLAFRTLMQHWQSDKDRKRRYVAIRDQPTEAERILNNEGSKEGTLLTGRGVEEKVRIMVAAAKPATAWRFSSDLPRALITVIIAGMGYLLMLAVMTYNVGYFFSVLVGIFVGDLAVGRFTRGGGDH